VNRGGPLRRCSQRWATEDAALHSKLAVTTGATFEQGRCCGWWHEVEVPSLPSAKAKPAAAGYEGFPQPVRLAAIARDFGACLHCGYDRTLEVHHKRIKGMGGDSRAHTDCLCNALTLCRACHQWAHRERREAKAKGFVVPRGTLLPGSVSVMIHGAGGGGSTMFATCDGLWTTAAPSGVAA
jgi:hypothetical protein